jgi:hypothetical protein
MIRLRLGAAEPSKDSGSKVDSQRHQYVYAVNINAIAAAIEQDAGEPLRMSNWWAEASIC